MRPLLVALAAGLDPSLQAIEQRIHGLQASVSSAASVVEAGGDGIDAATLSGEPDLEKCRPTGAMPAAEASLSKLLQETVSAHGLELKYHANNPEYMMEHMAPFMRALPGNLFVVVDGPHANDAIPLARARQDDLAWLGLHAELEQLNCDELRSWMRAPHHLLVTFLAPEEIRDPNKVSRLSGCNLPEAPDEQIVSLFHGIDLTGVAMDSIKDHPADTDVLDVAELNFRGEGARTHQTSYPPLQFSRAFARPATCKVVGTKQLVGIYPTCPHPDSEPWQPGWPTLMRSNPADLAQGIAQLAGDYTVLFFGHSGKESAFPDSSGPVVEVSPVVRMKLGPALPQALAVYVVDEWSSGPDVPLMFSKPVIAMETRPVRDRLAQRLPRGSYFDASNAVLLDASQAPSALDWPALVQSALGAEEPARAAQRAGLAREVLGCIDGYEEYRAVFDVLRANNVDVKALYAAYANLPAGPANGLAYVDGLCNPEDTPENNRADTAKFKGGWLR